MTPVASCQLPPTSRFSFNRVFVAVIFSVLVMSLLPVRSPAQQYDSALYSGMQWRQIGPFRAGRVTAVTGVPGKPAVYYMGTAGGGAWKTTDGGMVWKPIFDKQQVASIGAMAVALSDPKVDLPRNWRCE